MDREELILAAFAAGGKDVIFSPVQAQKLFFLIDREAKHLVDGPHFNFRPYDYGPFDKSVYDAIDAMSMTGMTTVQSSGRYRSYGLTASGFARGSAKLDSLPENAKTFITEVANWVRSLSFGQLVSSVYQAYPDMKVNSIFRG